MPRTTDEEDETLGERMDLRERVVLLLLVRDGFPWTVGELGRELGDHDDAEDAVSALDGAGLVHRFMIASVEFVIPRALPGAWKSCTRGFFTTP